MLGFKTTILMISLCLITILDECSAYKRLQVRNLDPKIVGGKNAKIEDFPFMVRLEITVKPPNRVGCGGSYIRPLWVLTASHCLDINDATPSLKPSTGSPQDRVKLVMEKDDVTQRVYQSMLSEKLFIHPRYFRNDTVVDNDVGLIKIPTPFNITKKANTVPIPDTMIDYSHQEAVIIGWGNMNDTDAQGNAASPNKLQMLKTTILGMKNCSEWSENDKVICIGKKDQISCSGDSGGPLIYFKMVIGVCSYGFGCSGEYAVYENVYSYRSWIQQVTEGATVTSLHYGGVLILLMNILNSNIIV